MNTTTSAKERLANALAILLQDKKIDKISVSQITKQCGMTRPIFYHYFKDKYDLVLWVYKKDYEQLLSKQPEFMIYIDLFFQLILFLKNKRSFYKRVLNSNDINSLTNYITAKIIEDMCSIVKYTAGFDAAEELLFLIKLYAHTVSQEISTTFACDGDTSSENICHWLVDAMPPMLNPFCCETKIPKELFAFSKCIY